jgi:hypothetical protein
MNHLRIYLLLTWALSLGTLPLSAAPNHDHAHDHAAPEWAEAFGEVPLPEVWHGLRAAETIIEAALAQRRLEGLAEPAETIHLAAHALMDQVRLPDANHQIRLAAALNQAAGLADEVLGHAADDQPDHAAASFRRLQSAINLARLRLPSSVTARKGGRAPSPLEGGPLCPPKY